MKQAPSVASHIVDSYAEDLYEQLCRTNPSLITPFSDPLQSEKDLPYRVLDMGAGSTPSQTFADDKYLAHLLTMPRTTVIITTPPSGRSWNTFLENLTESARQGIKAKILFCDLWCEPFILAGLQRLPETGGRETGSLIVCGTRTEFPPDSAFADTLSLNPSIATDSRRMLWSYFYGDFKQPRFGYGWDLYQTWLYLTGLSENFIFDSVFRLTPSKASLDQSRPDANFLIQVLSPQGSDSVWLRLGENKTSHWKMQTAWPNQSK